MDPLKCGFAILLVLSQTAAGGQQADVFDPADPKGLVLWLDGADSNTLFVDTEGKETVSKTRQRIAMWLDKSGSDNSARQPLVAHRPTFAVNARHGQSAVTFNGSRQFLRADAFGPNLKLEDWTSFLVVQANPETTNGTALMAVTTPVKNRRGFRFMPSCKAKRCIEFKSKAERNEDVSSNFPTSDTWQIWEFASNKGLVTVAVNGDEKARRTISPSSIGDLHTTAIGGRPQGETVSEAWDGHLGEILFYAQTLKTPTRTTIRAHLAAKWHISLAD